MHVALINIHRRLVSFYMMMVNTAVFITATAAQKLIGAIPASFFAIGQAILSGAEKNLTMQK